MLVAAVAVLFLIAAGLWVADLVAPTSTIAQPGLLHRINVNTAPASDLQLLPGVGPTLADRIIAERAARSFTDAADLRRVSGIGEKLPDRIAPHVKFEQ